MKGFLRRPGPDGIPEVRSVYFPRRLPAMSFVEGSNGILYVLHRGVLWRPSGDGQTWFWEEGNGCGLADRRAVPEAVRTAWISRMEREADA